MIIKLSITMIMTTVTVILMIKNMIDDNAKDSVNNIDSIFLSDAIDIGNNYRKNAILIMVMIMVELILVRFPF